MRYGLVAGGAVLLLLVLLGVGLTPGGVDASPGAGASGADASALAPDPLAGITVLQGRVQDARGAPVAARVLVFEAGPAETQEGLERRVATGALEARERASVPTDPRGAFSLRIPDGRYHLLAEVEGRPAALALEVQPGPAEVLLVVADGERLQGRVVDALGGVPRARVTVMSLAPVRRLREVESDETGAFEVEGLPAQARHGLWARAEAHGERVLLVPASRPATVPLPCTLRVEGRVLERGAVAPGARVWSRAGDVEARADDAGHFVLEGLDCGRAELYAESATGVGQRVLEALGADTSGLELELEAAGGLHVRVVEARSGRALAGASVESPASPEARWREEGVGHFRAAPLLPGSHVLLIRAPGHGAVQRTVTVDAGPATQLEVTLQPESVLAGRILGPEGLGMEGARIDLTGPGRGGAPEVRTGADGRFEVRELTGDRYDLRVERPGYLPVMREVRLPRTEPLELTLWPAAAVAVKVYGARGAPVEEASVSLTLVGEGRGEMVREEGTDARGGVHFGGLVPGSYKVQARAPGHLTSEPVPVEAWGEDAVPVRLTLREGLTLSGRVRDARGAPVGEAEVGVLEEGTSVSSARTDAQGRFTLSGLVPGRLRLRVEKFGHPTRDTEVVVPAPSVELLLEGPGAGE
jgi:hypothetical protein